MKLHRVRFLTPALLCGLWLSGLTGLNAAPTTRAADFTDALAQAKQTGNDIVVLQRGSDWNRLGETLFQTVWQRPEFAKSLGDGFVLVTVDRPEQPGAPALGSTGDGTSMAHFTQATADGAPLPSNEASAVRAEGGATFKKRADGTWLLDDPKGAHNPATDTVELTVQPRDGGSILRLDFLPDASLPGGGGGRASNGNFVISEIEISSGGKPLAVSHAWANVNDPALPTSQVIDGIKDKPDKGWNGLANLRLPRTLMLVLDSPVRGGSSLKVSLVCHSQWPQHVPACLRAAVLDDSALAASLGHLADAQLVATKNATFTWWDGNHCPRVALVDAEGRAVAAEDKPRGDLTPESLATRVKTLRDKRVARDEFLAKAEKAQGPDKAELLRQALDVLEIRNWPGNGNCYKPIHDKIKEADPQDVSGATRWLGFSSDPKGGVPWAKPAWNEAIDTQGGKRVPTDADYQEALARVDKELADPRNKILSHENIQRIMVAKFHIYRSWKGHEDKRFDVQKEIAAFDPATFWGIGANGYIGMYCKSPVPYLTYGWKPNQLTAGLNSWKIEDTAYYFDHPGTYKVVLSHAAGADKLRVKRIALLDGGTVLAEARPDADLGPAPSLTVETLLDCGKWKPDRHYTFLAELEAAAGHTDSTGKFSIEPWFIEPAAAPVTPAPDYAKVQRDLLEKLNTALAPNRDSLDKVLVADATRKDIARHELLRRCGADVINQVALRPGGSAFLQAFTNDVAWMESFLANDDAKWPLAIENLRFLHCYAREIDQPLYRTLGTAIALAAADMNRYRMLDRFRDIIRTHREGLMHASFDNLDSREMRWAVLLAGTAVDYQFHVDVMQMRMAEWPGACWGIPYIDPNVYGYSVQGWGYVEPWCHYYGTGTGDRPFRVQVQVGGVCGTLSGFGANTARAHGVLATTVGQPGHCAYVVREGEGWATGNDVFGPEANAASVFEGTGFPTMDKLYEVIHADKHGYLQSSRLAWAAHVFQDHKDVGTSAWGQAIAAQPINYGLWLECIKALEAKTDLPSGTWQKMIGTLATSFAPYHEAGWALIDRCYAKVAPSLKPDERMALLLQCHQQLKQTNAPKFMGYNLAAVLNLQADSLGDPALAVDFLRRLMVIHYSTDPTQNRVFSAVMDWGRTRFSTNPATASAYAQAIGSFYSSQGTSADIPQMTAQITAGIRKASEVGDLPSYQIWTAMAAKLLPPVQPADVHLTPDQAKAVPHAAPFPGDLLSKDALLQTSSACQFDRPLSYRSILDGTAPGWFDTNNEEKPWAEVILPADSEITGLVAVNRYEYSPDQEEFKWAAPFKVLISTDGKTWKEIATCDKPEAAMRLDLTGKAPRARFIRLERQAPADGTKPGGRFHLRNLLIYGRKLR